MADEERVANVGVGMTERREDNDVENDASLMKRMKGKKILRGNEQIC